LEQQAPLVPLVQPVQIQLFLAQLALSVLLVLQGQLVQPVLQVLKVQQVQQVQLAQQVLQGQLVLQAQLVLPALPVPLAHKVTQLAVFTISMNPLQN
jgi:hypothetical protein